MIWFKDRKKLDDLYKEWVKENDVVDESFNVIAFLEINNLLDRDKVKEFLGSDKEIERLNETLLEIQTILATKQKIKR